METTRQVSVFLENKPGRLANVLRVLEKQKVNVTGLTVMDSHDNSVLRLVTNDTDRTMQVLRELGTPCPETDVLLVELRNQPGALARVCESLAAEHVNVDYCYCSSGGRNGRVFGIFKVSHNDKAIKVLTGGNNHKRGARVVKRPRRDPRSYSSLE